VGGGGPAGAGVGAAIALMYLAATAIGLVAAGIAAALRMRRQPAAPADEQAPIAWRRGATSAAAGLVSLFAIQLVAPSAVLAVGAAAAVVVALALAAVRPRRPLLIGAAAPALLLATLMVGSAIQQGMKAADDSDTRYLWSLEELAERHDIAGLRAALDEPAYRRRKPPMESAIELLTLRGDHLAEIGIILDHPATDPVACIRVLRAARAGDRTAFERAVAGDAGGAALQSESCMTSAAHVAARASGWARADAGAGAVLSRAAAALPAHTVIGQGVYGLAKAGDFEAARRLLRAAGMLDGRGKIAPRIYDDTFLHSLLSHLDTPAERRFACEVADVAGLLVAVSHDAGEGYELERTLACAGARDAVDARLPCGATPLTALLSGSRSRRALHLLLDAGADPNQPGAPFCLEPAPPAADAAAGGATEAPLWVLARQQQGAWSYADADLAADLLAAGADPDARSADGKALPSTAVTDAEPDRALLERLRTAKRPGARSRR